MVDGQLELGVSKAIGLFDSLSDQPLDAMLTLLQRLRSDPRSGKIDLGIGVYGDKTGATPIMRAVKMAEARLVETQQSKAYLAPEGDEGFLKAMAPVILGGDLAASSEITGLQTPGGTGALRLAAALIHKANPEARIWLGLPTWPNHASLMEAAGLVVLEHPFFDTRSQSICFDEMMARLDASARAGDCLLLHACCHNPTGADFSDEQWQAVGELLVRKGMIPLIDAAYQGLGQGLEEDAKAMRDLVKRVPEALIACSNSKNFGLYRDRIGSVWVKAHSVQASRRARANMILLARSMWSMPPDHGASIVRTILESEDLKRVWTGELAGMRERIQTMRRRLAETVPELDAVSRQSGLFSLLPLNREVIIDLRETYGIYMLESGRINISGLTEENLPTLAKSLSPESLHQYFHPASDGTPHPTMRLKEGEDHVTC